MVLIEVVKEDYGFIWVDGFVPTDSQWLRHADKPVRDAFKRGICEFDSAYSSTLGRLMDRHTSLSAEGNSLKHRCDLYLLNPRNDAREPHHPTPVLSEYQRLGQEKEQYRVIMLATPEDQLEWFGNALESALHKMSFAIRDQKDYRDLDRYENYLYELSESFACKYEYPNLEVERSLQEIGFSTDVEFL